MKIFKHINNSLEHKKFLIPKSQASHCAEWVEVHIDNQKQIFTATKIKLEIIGEEWVELNDYTFPSSLLNEFLNS